MNCRPDAPTSPGGATAMTRRRGMAFRRHPVVPGEVVAVRLRHVARLRGRPSARRWRTVSPKHPRRA